MENKKNEKRNRTVCILGLVALITSTLCVVAGLRLMQLESELHPSPKQEFANLNGGFKGCDTLTGAVNTKKVKTFINHDEDEPARLEYFFITKEKMTANLYYNGETVPLNVEAKYLMEHDKYKCSYLLTLDEPGRYVVEIGYKGATIYYPMHLVK